jgi:hypothetical protein
VCPERDVASYVVTRDLWLLEPPCLYKLG